MVVESGAKQCFIELAKADTSADYDKALKIANKGKFLKHILINMLVQEAVDDMFNWI